MTFGVHFPVMSSKTKEALGGVLGCVVMIAVAVLAIFLIRGMVWASDKVMPWLNLASEILLGIAVLVLLPMSFFRKSRPLAGIGFYFGSYVFGLTLWAFSCLVCYYIWGYMALIIGLILAGIGVMPVAVIASLFTGHWSLLWSLIFQIVLTFGTRYLGMRLIHAADERRQAEAYVESVAAGEE
jgi:hypothetical protein